MHGSPAGVLTSQEFFSKLYAMNRVERFHQREQAIKSNADLLWRNLCAALLDTVKSFNEHYQTDPSRPVKCQPRTGEVEVSCQLPLTGKPQVEKIRHAIATVTLDSVNLKIHCSYQGSKAAPLDLLFDTEDNQTVFLKGPDGERLQDMDAASELSLRRFLMEPKN